MTIVIRKLDGPAQAADLAPLNSITQQPSGCCGGAAPSGADACCALDADVKAAGGSGCGCGSTEASAAVVHAPKEKSGCC